MKNKIFAAFIILIFLAGTFFVSAHSDEEFAAAQQLIASRISCSQLSQSQLIEVGDYYMQLILGSAHEQMDAMMGGDNATMDEQMHIAIAERYYCNGVYLESLNGSINSDGTYGMMSSGGMMGSYGTAAGYNPGMMYGYSYQSPLGYYLPWILLALVVGAGTAVAIVLLTRKNASYRKR